MASDVEPIEPAGNKLNIELSEEVAEGVYTNLAIISHSNAEFVLDFIRIVPGVPKARVKSRLIMTPMHTKRLLAALQDNVRKFEEQNGEIDFRVGEEDPVSPIGFGGGPHGVA